MADKAVEFIRDAKVIDPDKPFFMYLAPQAGHAPHLVPLEWADRYKGVFDEGYEAIRAGILQRQINLGLLPEGTDLSVINPHGEPERTGPDGQTWPLLDTVRPWDTLNPDEQRLFTRMAEVFAGYISYNDDRLGRVLDYLEDSGQIDNTLIIVVSDNGGSGEGGPNGSFNEWRFFNGVPDTTATTLPHIDELGTPASNNHYNTGWAWAFDTPFPYWKRWAGEEGGVADMCIISWPDRIPASTEPRQQYVHAVDSCPDDLRPSRHRAARDDQRLPAEPDRGRELRRRPHRPDSPRQETQFYTMLGQRSIYHEGWLASTVHPPLSSWGNFDKDEWELFHLETDRSQSTNVAADHPDRLEELKNLWFYYAGIYNGLPLDDRSALEQVLAERPRGGPVRDQYVFYPDCADVPESAGPAIPGRSYTIAAGVKSDSADAEGVLWAAGGVPGGHSLYIKDGRLRYTFNWIGTVLQDVVAEQALTPGSHVLAAEFTATGPSTNPDMPGTEGTLTLFVDDQTGRPGADRHPARLLLPDRRRHLRRTRQRISGHSRVRGTVPLHRRIDRPGGHRPLRGGLRGP